MSRGKPATMVALTPRQRSLLIKQRNKARVTVQQRNRIDIILGASAGQSNLHLCQRLSVGRSMVTHWRKHWAVSYSSLCTYQAGVAGQGVSDRDLLSRMLAVLEDAPRSGAPVRISMAQKPSTPVPKNQRQLFGTLGPSIHLSCGAIQLANLENYHYPLPISTVPTLGGNS